MARVILGAFIVGFFLASPLLSFIEDSDFYYSHFSSDTVDVYFGITVAVIGALIGGYVGSKLNQYNAKQKQAGRSMNKNAEYSGKIMMIFVVLALFSFMTAIDIRGSYPGVQYIYWATLIIPAVASILAIRALIQINKTKEIGMLVAITTLAISVLFYTFQYKLLVFLLVP